MKKSYPTLIRRLFAVWSRHERVYVNHIFANGLPPFLEPLLFLAAIGFGLGKFVPAMEGIPYIKFLASGLLISTAMMTAAFECSYGTFIRLEFEKVYESMLAAPVTATDLVVGEIIWAGTKGFFFSFAVLLIVVASGIIREPLLAVVPFIGFATGLIFAVISLTVTSFVKVIENFTFYFTGFLTPLFFFSGAVFPIESLPKAVRPLIEILPLTHPVRLARAVIFHRLDMTSLFDLGYIVIFIAVFGVIAVRRIGKRLVS